MILKNLLRSKRRMILSVLSVSVSIFIFCALITIVTLVNSFMERANKSALIGITDRYESSETGLPQTHVNTIRVVPGVRAAMGVNLGRATWRDDKDFIGVWAADHFAVKDVLAAGPGEENSIPAEDFQNFEKDRAGALVGKVWMTKFGWKKGDQIIVKAAFPLNPMTAPEMTLRIAGEIPTGFWDSRLIIRRDYFQGMTTKKDTVDMVLLCARDLAMVQPVCQGIEAALDNSMVPVRATTSAEFFNQFMSGVNLKSVISMISLVVFIATISIMANSMALAIRERKREVAILKTLGFSQASVLGLLLGESVLLAGLGGILGAIAAYALFSTAGVFLKVGPLSYFEVPLSILLYGIGGAMLIGVASGLVPSVNACRAPIIGSMREVS
jgi:putative ABC transport system permease protein